VQGSIFVQQRYGRDRLNHGDRLTCIGRIVRLHDCIPRNKRRLVSAASSAGWTDFGFLSAVQSMQGRTVLHARDAIDLVS